MANLQDLSDCGLNPFAAVLLAESLLKHPNPKAVEFVLPIRRSDCKGWSGVKFSLTPIPEGAATQTNPDIDVEIVQDFPPKG